MPAKTTAKAESLMFNLFTDYEYDDVKENVFSNSVANAPAFCTAPTSVAFPKSARIEDFGEKIGGARKDMYSVYKDLLSYAAMSEVGKLPFSKAWPKPNYEKLLATGIEPWRVSAIRALRETVDAIPRRYHHSFESSCARLREYAVAVMDGTIGDYEKLTQQVRASEQESRYNFFQCSFRLYEELGHAHELPPFEVYHEDKVSCRSSRAEWMIGQLLKKHSYCIQYSYEGDTEAEALEKFVDALKERFLPKDSADMETCSVHAQKSAVPKLPKDLTKVYSVYRFQNRETSAKEYYICRKVGKNLVQVKGPFEDSKYAFMFKDEHLEEIDERFHAMKNLPNERGEENKPRAGASRRTGDVSPDNFMKAFGFRGVEFGNYVEGTRRQNDLNDAYDALMDLAQVTGLPSRALSLGGRLGLAFGARGHGGKHPALAHYESMKTVINLTKKRGAGSLGHEWFHALDNLLAREHGKGSAVFFSENHASISHVELYEAMDKLRGFIGRETKIVDRSQKLDKFRTKPYWGTTLEVMARSFEAYLKAKLSDAGIENDYLVNVLDEKTWHRKTAAPYAYPTKAETELIAPYFDNLFANIQQRTEGENIILYSASADIDAKALEQNRIPCDQFSPEEIGLHVFGEQVLGIETAFYDGDPKLHGHFDRATSTIYLNRSSECDLPWVFAHEAFHAMKEADPSLYAELMEYAGGAESFSKEKMDAYRAERQKPNMPDELVRQEMLADAFADYTTGRRAVAEMAEKQPNTLRRTINFLSRAMEDLKSRFFGVRKGETEEKYPAARISREQFSDLAHGLEDMREELRRQQHLTKGQEMLLLMLADAPKMDSIHSPFAYAPEKQFAFDCQATRMMGEMYPKWEAAKTVAAYSPCGGEGYEARLVASARGRAAGR